MLAQLAIFKFGIRQDTYSKIADGEKFATLRNFVLSFTIFSLFNYTNTTSTQIYHQYMAYCNGEKRNDTAKIRESKITDN